MTAGRMVQDGIQPHLAVGSADVAPLVVLVRTERQVDQLAEHLDDARVRASNRQYRTVTGRASGRDVSIVSTGLGGPSVAIAIEELVRAGSRAMVLVEAALTPVGASAGRVVLATGAVRSDGTSCEYFPLELPAVADFRLYTAVRAAAASRHLAVAEGLVRTVDRLGGEETTGPALGIPVAGVDMATAVAYTLAQRHGHPIVSLLRTGSLAEFAAMDGTWLDAVVGVAIDGLVAWWPTP